jgi:transposase
MVFLQAYYFAGESMTEGGREGIRSDDSVVSAAEVRELKKRIRELERVLGKKTLEE